jgi:hypothetical protein
MSSSDILMFSLPAHHNLNNQQLKLSTSNDAIKVTMFQLLVVLGYDVLVAEYKG